MKSVFQCYLTILKTRLSEKMAYRGDFVISMLMMLIGDMILPMVTYLVYQTGASFPGWTLEEVIVIQGVFLLSKGIAFPFFFGMISMTLQQVREGTYDFLLLKPRSTLFLTLILSFELNDFGRLLSGGVLFGISLTALPQLGITEWLHFLLLFVCAVIVLFAFSLFFSGILFKWVGSSRVFDIFDSLSMFGFYPGTIYSSKLQHLLLYIIPILMIGFIPAATLLRRPIDGLIYSIFASLLLLVAGLTFWHMMLKKYTSAGG